MRTRATLALCVLLAASSAAAQGSKGTDRKTERRAPPKPAPAPSPAPPPKPAPAPPAPQPQPKPPPPAQKPSEHPEDEAIIQNLELFMLMEMLKDYEILRETDK